MDKLDGVRASLTRVFTTQAYILQEYRELPAEFVMNITRYDFEGLFRAIGQTIDCAGGCDKGQIRDMINRLNKDFDFLYNQASTVQTDGK